VMSGWVDGWKESMQLGGKEGGTGEQGNKGTKGTNNIKKT
jgi:hypothetical protein